MSDNHQQSLLSQARTCINARNFDTASAICRQLFEQWPTQVSSWTTGLRLGLEAKNFEYAHQCLHKAINLQSRSTEVLLLQSRLLLDTNQSTRSYQVLKDISLDSIKTSELSSELGALYYRHKKFKEAKKAYQQSITLDEGSADGYYSLASVEQYLGNFDAALKRCEQAIAIKPDHFESQFLRSNLKKQTASVNNTMQLKVLAERGSPDQVGHSMLCFALAKELEDIRNYSESFYWRKKAGDCYRTTFSFDCNDEVNFLNQIKKVYSKNILENISSNKNNEAIFVLGLPRTGSTLIERIITSQDTVKSAGELTYFPNLLSNAIGEAHQGGPVTRQELVKLSTQVAFEKIGAQYLDHTLAERQASQRFVDKFPQNSIYTGLIHMALPKAKIVLVERHPLDACYAIYKQMFTDIYQYSYKLDELADYYIAYYQLMEHWKETLGDVIHVVSYDNLISDSENVIEKLINYCELDWSEQYLDFQNNKQASTTASAVQVRQKLYSSSVGMWRNYHHELAPLIERLKNAHIPID
jgi:tetratricopeptide (TPR) repeat protein